MLSGVCCARTLSTAGFVSRRHQSQSRLHLVYFGSDQYSLAHLKALADRACSDQAFHIQHVVTANDATPVADYCTRTGLNYSTWPRGSTECAQLLASRVQTWQSGLALARRSPVRKQTGLLGLVISFGRYLPTALVAAFGRGCINIHPSLLPRWRGPCPLLHTLLAGDEISGVSAIRLPTNEHSFDTGPVLHQHAVRLNSDQPMTTSQLGDFLTPYSIQTMFEVLDQVLENNVNRALPQSMLAEQYRLMPTSAPRPSESMGHVDWKNYSASDIVRLWHCLQGTSVSVTSSLRISTPHHATSDVHTRFVGRKPVALPMTTASEAILGYQLDGPLLEAALLLQRIPPNFPFGGLIYLRSQNQRNYPLIPFAFIACKPSASSSFRHSWLAIPSVHIRIPGAHQFRPLTALDLYNGFLCESESGTLSHIYQLPRGFHPFYGFRSLSTPISSMMDYRKPLRDSTMLSLVNNVYCPKQSISTQSRLDSGQTDLIDSSKVNSEQ